MTERIMLALDWIAKAILIVLVALDLGIVLSGLSGCASPARTTNTPASVKSHLEESHEGPTDHRRSGTRLRILPGVGGEGFPVAAPAK